MKNVDVEIYMNQLISFFDKNPNDLIDIVGEENKKLFFEKIKEQCYKNVENGEEIPLSRNQLLEIVIELKKQDKNYDIKEFKGVLQKTKFGDIYLN